MVAVSFVTKLFDGMKGFDIFEDLSLIILPILNYMVTSDIRNAISCK